MKTITKHSHKGFILISALLITSISFLLLIPYAAGVLADLKLTLIINNSNAAINLAEAGIERALWEIYWNNSAFSGWTSTTDGHKISVNSFQDSTGKIVGDYDVDVVTLTSGITITATGYAPNRASPVKKTARVILDSSSKSVFTAAVSSLGTITMTGNTSTDSYDSSKRNNDGNLVGYNGLLPDGSRNIGQEGHMMTNENINMSGSAVINGDARTGPGYPFLGNATGATGTLSVPLTAKPISTETLNNAQLNTDYTKIEYDKINDPNPVSGTVLSITDTQVITIPEGTYYFTRITTTGTSQINITGTVKIFVDGGAINISGSGIMNNLQPRNLMIYSTGTSIDYSGSSDLRAAIYAPNAYFNMTGSAELFGSVICGSNTDTGSSRIHRDLDLLTLDPLSSGDVNYTFSSWQEI